MKKTNYLIFCFVLISFLGKAQKPLLQWVKNFGGAGSNMSGTFISMDASNNMYTTGYFTGTVDFDPGIGVYNLTSAGLNDFFVVKLNNTGSFVWAKRFGGIGNDYCYTVAVDGSGNIYTTGNYEGTVDFDPGAGVTNLTASGAADIYISKLDQNGNFMWAKSIGGTGTEYSNSLDIDPSGNIYATGNYPGTIDFDPNAGVSNLTSSGGDDIFILKLDANGNFIWAKSMGGTGFEYSDTIELDGSGNIYTTGNYEGTVDFDPNAGVANLTSLGTGDMYVSKLDAAGNFVWAKSIGGTIYEAPNGLTVDGTGMVYITGNYNGSVDFDPGAGTFSLTAVAGDDIFVSKLDNAGNFLWAKSMGGMGNEYGFGITTDAFNNVYFSGFHDGTVDFDPGAATFTISTHGGNDAYISKLDPSGLFQWAKNIGGSGNDNIIGIVVDAGGTVYSTGRFAGTVDFDPNAGTKNLTSLGSGDVFVHRMLQCNLKTMAGTVSGSSGGNVILYQYIPTLSKWDSVAFTPYSSSYSFGLIDSSSYVIKAVPTATNEQVTYFGNAISWQNATIVNHGCIANTTNTIAIATFTNIGTGTGSMSGKIVEVDGFEKKTTVPGNPIGGIIVKGGRNPGGQMFSQTTTDPLTGTYTLTGIPNGTNYFILVDIPGLDTNLTYHRDLLPGNNQLTGLDFTVDSMHVNPSPNWVGLHDLNVQDYQLRVFPNPTSDHININYDLKEISSVSIELVDITGRFVSTLLPRSTQHVESYQRTFQLTDLNSGMYFIKLKINDNESVIKLCLTN
jgi:hypothetical protein